MMTKVNAQAVMKFFSWDANVAATVDWSKACMQMAFPVPDFSLLLNPHIGRQLAEEWTPAEVRLREAEAAEARSRHLLKKIEKEPLKTPTLKRIEKNVRNYRREKTGRTDDVLGDMTRQAVQGLSTVSPALSGVAQQKIYAKGPCAATKKELLEKEMKARKKAKKEQSLSVLQKWKKAFGSDVR